MSLNKQKTIIIIGGGAAGLMTAMQLNSSFNVIIIEKEKSIGRKLLVAGNGGFNLTNDCEGLELINKYSPPYLFKNCLNLFSPENLQAYLFELGIETYTGTSGRVFPKEGIKPIEVLAAFKLKLKQKNVTIKLNHKFISFSDNKLEVLNAQNKKESVHFDYCVFALGGASWSKTGSDGKWVSIFESNNININPFQASNCGVNINWDSSILNHHEGKPLKNISFSVANKTVKGEGLITSYGMEGNAIYPLIGKVRDQLEYNEDVQLLIDFKPNNTLKELMQKMKGKSHKNYTKVLNLAPLEMALLKYYTSKNDFLDSVKFIYLVKNLPISITSLRPIEEAISTVGGIGLDSIQADFSLKNNPNIFTIGEMLDWDAPTGGFLLQACFSMGYSVSKTINELQ